HCGGARDGSAIVQSPTRVAKRQVLHEHRPADRAGRSRCAHAHYCGHRDVVVSFDAIAPWYRTLETIAFGQSLQRARDACLAEISAPRRALIVGEGNGRFLCELLRAHPALEVDCVESSKQMIELAQERIGPNANRVRF